MTRVAGIELVRVGSWSTSTGPWRVTASTLRAALDAHTAGVIRRPIVKIGHRDEPFVGEPAFGHIDAMRLSADGAALIGDLVVPAWLAAAMPANWPDRSVEAEIDWVDGDGRTWPCVISAVALLGAEAPAISSLKSLQDLVAASSSPRRVTARITPSHHHTVLVASARRRRRNRKATT